MAAAPETPARTKGGLNLPSARVALGADTRSRRWPKLVIRSEPVRAHDRRRYRHHRDVANSIVRDLASGRRMQSSATTRFPRANEVSTGRQRVVPGTAKQNRSARVRAAGGDRSAGAFRAARQARPRRRGSALRGSHVVRAAGEARRLLRAGRAPAIAAQPIGEPPVREVDRQDDFAYYRRAGLQVTAGCGGGSWLITPITFGSATLETPEKSGGRRPHRAEFAPWRSPYNRRRAATRRLIADVVV